LRLRGLARPRVERFILLLVLVSVVAGARTPTHRLVGQEGPRERTKPTGQQVVLADARAAPFVHAIARHVVFVVPNMAVEAALTSDEMLMLR